MLKITFLSWPIHQLVLEEEKMPGVVLFALAFDFIPELAEWRDRYTYFWALVGGVAILGWVAVFVLSRYLPRSEVAKPIPFRPAMATLLFVGLSAILGGWLGWELWRSGSLWYWDSDARKQAELISCVLGVAGWGAVVGQLLLFAFSFVMKTVHKQS